MLSPQHEEAKSKRCPPDIGSSALPSLPMPLARADQVIEEGCCLLHCMSRVMALNDESDVRSHVGYRGLSGNVAVRTNPTFLTLAV